MALTLDREGFGLNATSCAPMQTTSEQLVARKADRRIDLLGKVVIVDETPMRRSGEDLKALALVRQAPERRFLEQRLGELDKV